jgi:peptidoglycan hydrolase-like protein with peptidoglycan-binding domain
MEESGSNTLLILPAAFWGSSESAERGFPHCGDMAKRKRIEVEEEDVPEGVSPVAAVVWSASAVAALMVVYNVFYGQPDDASRIARQAQQEFNVAGNNSGKSSSNTIVLRYDRMIEDLQRELLATGHYKGLVDGVAGARTHDAIVAYQRDNGLSGEPKATQSLLDHVRYTRKLTAASEFTASVEKPEKPLPGDAAIASLQEALAELGYDPGDVTGTLNASTREAIRKLEQRNGLPVDGLPDPDVMAVLSQSAAPKSDAPSN